MDKEVYQPPSEQYRKEIGGVDINPSVQPEFIARKRALARRYAEAFAGVRGAVFFTEPAHCASNYWLNVLLLDRAEDRQSVLEATNAAGYMTRPAWTLMHKLPMFTDCPRMELPAAEDLEARLVNIPSGAAL